MTLVLADWIKAIRDRSPDAFAYVQLTQPRLRDNEASFDISYTAELTDDGKNIYVTVDGL